MKNVIWIAVLILSNAFLYGQTTELNSEQIIVRSFESGGINTSAIFISYGDGELEEVDLKGFNKVKNWGENLTVFNTVLNRIRKHGYTLVNSNSAANPSYIVSTYIFLRNDLIYETKQEQID